MIEAGTSVVQEKLDQLRTELVERSFALTLDRGGMRRSWLAAARTCTNATSCTSPATISA